MKLIHYYGRGVQNAAYKAIQAPCSYSEKSYARAAEAADLILL